jgi:hypothetical protein
VKQVITATMPICAAHPALTISGTIGWLLFLAYFSARECRAGHIGAGIFLFLLLAMLPVDFWAVEPLTVPSTSYTFWLLWAAALLPYFFLVFRALRRRNRRKS